MSGRANQDGGGIEISDLDELPGCPIRRYGHSATFVPDVPSTGWDGPGRLLVFGGAPSDVFGPGKTALAPSVPFFNTMLVVHVEEDDDRSIQLRWGEEAYPDLVSDAGRHFHSCVFNSSDGRLYIFGGKSNGYRNDIISFDASSMKFAAVHPRLPSDSGGDSDTDPSVLCSPPSPRWGHSAVLRPGKPSSMLVFGGYDSNGFVHNGLYEFIFPSTMSRTPTKGFWRRLLVDELKGVPRRYLHSGLIVPVPQVPQVPQRKKEECEEGEGEGECAGAGGIIFVGDVEKTKTAQFVIIRGLEKTGKVLDDVWCVDVDACRVRRVEIASSMRRKKKSVASYGQRCFVVDGKLYSYGGRSRGDEIRECFRLDLVEDLDQDCIRGEISKVRFPFKKSALLSYGSVSVVGNHVLFFGGQKWSPGKMKPMQKAKPAVRPGDPVLRSRAARLLHVCPEEILLDMLAWLDAQSLCDIRAVAQNWSPSVVSSHDRLWAPIYEKVVTGVRFSKREKPPDEIRAAGDDQVSLKMKCRAIMKHKLDLHLMELAEECFVEKGSRLDVEAMCEKFRHAEPSKEKWDFKVFFIGNVGSGKTCTMARLVNGEFPEDYIPTVWEPITIEARMTKHVKPRVSLWDSGHGDYEGFRFRDYPGTDVVVINYGCFDVRAYEYVKTTWIPEVREHVPDAVVVLCVTKTDWRGNPRAVAGSDPEWARFISREEGVQLAKEIGASFYLETSSKTGAGMNTLRGVTCAAGLLRRFRDVGVVPAGKKSKCSVM